MFEGEGNTWRVAMAAVGGLVVVGLLAASFVFSAGGDVERAKEAVKKKTASPPPQPPGRAGPLILPTHNYALFEEDGGPDFYQYTDRLFEGRRSRPWKAGQYGFVRNPVRTDEGVIYTRFHEGIDIQATRRDDAGEPLDTVRAIGTGTVAYLNDSAGGSNYGKYVVVEHEWGGAPYYSLYAHLSKVKAKTGAHVARGAMLGRMGHTGVGINRRRAHVHLEINVLLNGSAAAVQRWFTRHGLGTNTHGVYTGLNMRGLDPAAYFKALRADPDRKITDFIDDLAPYYKLTFPRRGSLDILNRYPWLLEGSAGASGAEAWEFSFTRGGFPLSVTPADSVGAPTVTMDPPVQGVNCSYLTYAHLQGTVPGCTLAPRGERYVDLLTLSAPGAGGTRAW